MISPAQLSGDREIVITRLLDAPRERVFRLWTTPEHITRWWGPVGFTTTVHEMNVVPGGRWKLTMHGPDGRDYRNTITFLEVLPPEKLVFRHGGDQMSEPVSHTTFVTFTDENGRTRLDMRMVFESAEARDSCIRTYGALNGLTSTIGRLEQYLGDIK